MIKVGQAIAKSTSRFYQYHIWSCALHLIHIQLCNHVIMIERDINKIEILNRIEKESWLKMKRIIEYGCKKKIIFRKNTMK